MSKRLGVFAILTLLLFLFATTSCATAEEVNVDISGMTTEELLKLKTQINDSLFAKNGMVELPCGEYVAGRDIAAGSYVITMLENRYTSGNVTVTVYNTPDAKVKYDSAYKDYQIRWTLIEEALNKDSSIQITEPEVFDATQYYATNTEQYFHAGESIRVNLDEGQMLYINYSAEDFFAVIEQATGLFMN